MPAGHGGSAPPDRDAAHELKFALAMRDPRQDTLDCKCRLACATAPLSGPENTNQANPPALLSWPASFWEYQPPRVRGAPKQTCQFERLATFRPRRHPPREFQSVGRAGIPIKPVDQVLRRFFAHRSVELLLPDLLVSSNSKTPVRVMFIPGFASHGMRAGKKQISLQISLFESKPVSKAIPIVVVSAEIRHSRKTHRGVNFRTRAHSSIVAARRHNQKNVPAGHG
jgi:hypothetical protein